jgi:AP-2 complex subunit alpha
MVLTDGNTQVDSNIFRNRLKEFIKEHLIDMPRTQVAPPPAPAHPQLPSTAPATYNDPGAMLAGLL